MAKVENSLDPATLIGELVAMYKLVHSDEIATARDGELGDGTKRKVWELSDGVTPQGAIAKKLKVTPQAISQHCKVLCRRGLLRKLDNGNYIKMLDD